MSGADDIRDVLHGATVLASPRAPAAMAYQSSDKLHDWGRPTEGGQKLADEDAYCAPFAASSPSKSPFQSTSSAKNTSISSITLRIRTGASFDGMQIPERPWLVPNLVLVGAVTLVYGDGSVGKSTLLMQFATAVATGTDWIGQLPKQGPVFYVSAEDDEDEIHRRLADIVASRGLKLSELGDLHVLSLAGKDAVLAAPDRAGIISATKLWYALLEAADRIVPHRA